MTDFQIGFIVPAGGDGEEPPEEVDPDVLRGQIHALTSLLSAFMLTHWKTPEIQERNAAKIESALLQEDLVRPLERVYGTEFVDGYRGLIRSVVRFLQG